MNSGTHNLYLRLQTCGRFACKSARERRIVATEMVRGVVERLSLMFAVAKAPYHGIVFDAGSSGSRIHVYTFDIGEGGRFLLQTDDLLKIKPGLSAFKDEPSKAGESLRPLLEHAKSKVPERMWLATPTFLMATAGLRMVGEKTKDRIFESVCAEFRKSGFRTRCEWVTVLDGRDEGLYGWVTVNYLLDRLYGDAADSPAAVGTIDLGGGSVQIAFPASKEALSQGPGDYGSLLEFGRRKHDVYVKSHLGFGLDAARNSILDRLVERYHSRMKERPPKNPCLAKGAYVVHQDMRLEGDGDWHRCLKLIEHLFDESGGGTHCAYKSCSFGGAFQPALPKDFYGFSYMYDRTAAIGLIDGKPAMYGTQTMSRADITQAGQSLCAMTRDQLAERYATHPDGSKAANFCGDVVYVAALLDNLGFSENSQMTMTNKIRDVELVWTLGAMAAKAAELLPTARRHLDRGGSFLSMRTFVVVGISFTALWYASNKWRSRNGRRGRRGDGLLFGS